MGPRQALRRRNATRQGKAPNLRGGDAGRVADVLYIASAPPRNGGLHDREIAALVWFLRPRANTRCVSLVPSSVCAGLLAATSSLPSAASSVQFIAVADCAVEFFFPKK